MGLASKLVNGFSGSLVCLAMLSCSGGSKQGSSFTSSPAPAPAPAPTPTADFSLTAIPGSLMLIPGGAGQTVSVSAAAANGFTGPVSVTITGLPAGVTAAPASLSLAPGAPQSVTVTASASAAAGAATLTLTGTSGTLSHSAIVTAAIAGPPAPAADFSLRLAPTSVGIVAGGPGSAVSVAATAAGSFSGPVMVAITGAPAGVTASPATLTLTPGVAQSVTFSAALTAAASSSAVSFTGTSGSLTHSVSLPLAVQAASTTAAPDVTTYHFDVARDGMNAQETILTPLNVNQKQFGKTGFDTVDGKVDAQPLYLANVPLGGQLHNVLYVASEHDSVYAFDADNGVQLWKTSVLGSGETTSDDHGCSQITPEIGITSTPVIDRGKGPNGTLFLVGETKDGAGKYHQRLHALDVTTGAEMSSPTEIAATYPGTGANSTNGSVIFDPAFYAERAALLLLNGNVYTAWSSHCDGGPYTGWVMAYSESTLQQTQVLNVTPNGNDGSVWMAGDGLAADGSGDIYFLDANGTFDTAFDAKEFPAKGDYSNAMMKLATTGGALAVADYFEMFNGVDESNHDEDLGSGGELLLPDQTDANGGVHHLMVGAGKDGTIYLADRDNMGKFNAATNPEDSNLYQQVSGQLSGVYSSPAFFNGTLYYGSVGSPLRAFAMVDAKLGTAPSSQSATQFAYPGATPSVSANGTANGIVWALESGLGSPGVLHAYDATDLSKELYNSNQAANGRDSFGNGNKFITPMIVNGKVYVGTTTGVAVFGLLR